MDLRLQRSLKGIINSEVDQLPVAIVNRFLVGVDIVKSTPTIPTVLPPRIGTPKGTGMLEPSDWPK
ncbi:MAG: hypothetical protein CM15mP125_4320 [Gammaproteobacteria bacterium]|nr:MAG: hypothetical protein CM15mP125_4320 [Gammaproteobacteria bacterium]